MLTKTFRHNRGASLAVMLVIVPIVMGVFLLLLTRVDIAVKHTKRHHQRAQARLLAESALAAYQTGDTDSSQGAIEGAGLWRFNVDNDAGQLTAEGEVTKAQGSVASIRVVCELTARVTSSKKPELLDLKYRIMPVE